MNLRAFLVAVIPLALSLAGVAGPLQLVATTSILGDVVRQVAGGAHELSLLIPPDADPHTFEPTPQDLARISQADALFVCGAGLEGSLEPYLAPARFVVDVSRGVELRTFDDGRVDPHVWLDPLNVVVWAENVAQALAGLDPERAEFYRARASSYAEALRELDAWIKAQVERVPEGRRILVVDHLAFGYFAERYSFRQLAIIPGFSTLAEPSARELAELEAEIRALSVPALFLSHTTASPLIDQVARDTGVRVVRLYVGALSGPDGPAPSYLELMRYDVSAIVAVLGGG